KAEEAGDTARVAALQDLSKGLADKQAAKTKQVNLTAPSYDMTPAKFDNAKQQLDDLISEAKRGGKNYQDKRVKDLKERLVQRADEVTAYVDAKGNPQSLYRDARDSFATPSQQLDALEAGRNFENVHPDRLPSEYGGLTTAEKRQYRIGAADEVT